MRFANKSSLAANKRNDVVRSLEVDNELKNSVKKNGKKLPSYLGDMINSIEFNRDARIPNPERMINAYNQAASTQNLLRAFAYGGYADLSNVQNWNLDFVKQSKQGSDFKFLANRITECLNFMNACGINSKTVRQISETNFFISHEALLLPYEAAFTRIDSTTGDWYNVGAHMLWIGDRTRDPEGAHVEFCRGVENPIGIKCGPTLEKEQLLKLVEKLNPANEEGRLTLISRYGSEKVSDHLPGLIRIVKSEGLNVVWCCDPMHGNTIKSKNGFKTRPFGKVLSEVKSFFAIHKTEGTYPGGVHFEMTGKDVTECTGGSQEIEEEDLSSRYHTACDPRLNASQSLELAFLIAEEIQAFEK